MPRAGQRRRHPRGAWPRPPTRSSHWAEYDYVVVNDDLDRAFADVRTILAAERLKRERQPELSELRAQCCWPSSEL